MSGKGDVKAMMARFQAAGGSTDETSSPAAGRPKQPLHPTRSSGPNIQTNKPVSQSFSGSAINPPKPPSYLKNTVSTKSDTDVHEPNKAKALASRFGGTVDDTSTNSKPFIGNKQQVPFKPPLSQAAENKPPLQKPPFNKSSLGHTLSDPKPTFPKPSSAVVSKPSWVKEDNGGSVTSSTPPKLPLQQKPSSSIGKLRQQNEELAGSSTDTEHKPAPVPSPASKPASNFRNAQNMFNKEKTEPPDADVKPEVATKPPLTATNSTPPPKPPASKKPSIRKPHQTATPIGKVNSDATSSPKRNPLPNSLALGPAPSKPNRPPKVNLENFKRGAEASENGPGIPKKPVFTTPLTSHPVNNHVTPPQPPPPALPSLPPRHPGTMPVQEDFYDDVDEFSCPPPLPPTAGHPSKKQTAQVESDSDDGEMYEDLDERWEAAGQKQEKMKEKEEKKRQEADKKEQKEREKKEQDARKKFRLVGPLEAIHQVKASVDCRGSKTDLALKQGDSLDIIRVQGNPEGKWLGRTSDGSIGYVKTTSVEIDFNSLKTHKAQQAYDPEVYDDIDVADNSGTRGSGVVLPPLPGGEGGEIYDDVLDPNLEVSSPDPKSSPTKPRGFRRMFELSRRHISIKVVPPPSQFTAEGNADHPEAAIDEEIYDDVDSQNLPPLPPISSLPTLKGKNKSDEMDSRKQKKFEKEEKDFRKKFKFEGEIQVLYQVNIIPSLVNKKWGSKDLALKAGEKLDVIVKAVDNKLICRNEDGKFGYVSTSHIAMDDGDIYDDIGDDCIYDND